MNNKFGILILAVLLFITTAYAVPAPFDINFIAGWNFDDSSNTLSDINIVVAHTGTIGGTADINFIPMQANAMNGSSYRFNNIYAIVADPNSDFNATTFSGMTWFQIKNASAYGLMASMADRTGGQSAGWSVNMGLSVAGKVEFRMGSVDGAITETTLVSGSTYNDGAWHQLIWTYSGGIKRIFIDGALVGTQAGGLAYNKTNYVLLGALRINGAYNAPMDGNFDSTYFWDRNLSLAEIATLWNAGAGTFFSGTHLNSLSNSITSPAIGSTQTGFMDINFSIRDTNIMTPNISTYIYLSSTAGAKTTLVYTDLNLADGNGVICNDYLPFTTIRNCSYRVNSTNYSDGNYYIDINSYNLLDSNLASLGPFIINNSFDIISPVVGATTLTGFAKTGSFITGTGNVIGGVASDEPDYKFGSSFVLLKNDTNTYTKIVTNQTGQYIYTAAGLGEAVGCIIDSNDYGITWKRELCYPGGSAATSVAISDGNAIVAVAFNSKINLSTNKGNTWTTVDSNRTWIDVEISSDGKYIAATTNAGIYVSSNYGTTFTGYLTGIGGFGKIAMDGTGQYMIASMNGGPIYRSIDYGVTWAPNLVLEVSNWTDVVMSKNSGYGLLGNDLVLPGKQYITTNYGASYSLLGTPPGRVCYYRSSVSYDGQLMLCPYENLANFIAASMNYGTDFNSYNYNTFNIDSTAISDSKYSYGASTSGKIYVQNRDKRGLNTASCQYTIDNGVNWLNADWNATISSCTKNGITVLPGITYTFNTRIQDFTGNYGYGTATQSYLAANGSAIQFLVTNETQIPQANVDINFYTLSGGVRTALTNITTDISGIGFVILDYGTTYGIDVRQNGELVLSSNNIIITNPTYNILIPSIESSAIVPDVNGITVNWNPGIDYIYNDVVNLVQTITSNNVSDVNITIYQFSDWNSNKRIQLYSAAAACVKNCTVTTPLAAFTFDYNKPFYVDINLKITGFANRYIVTHKYVKPSSAAMAPLLDLIRNVRADFSCSLDTNYPCGISIIISIILTILLIATVIMMTGYAGPQGIGIIALAILGVFTYVGWFYWIAYAIIILVTILYIGKGVIE